MAYNKTKSNNGCGTSGPLVQSNVINQLTFGFMDPRSPNDVQVCSYYIKGIDTRICIVDSLCVSISVSGHSVPFCFNSGGECSLVNESVADKCI